MRRLVPCVTISLLLAACSPGGDGALDLPPVDAQAAEAVQEALHEVPPEMRGLFAARALAEIETGRLPASFIKGLDAMVNVAPDQRSMVLSRSLAESMPMLDRLCGDGTALMGSLAEMAPQQRNEAVFDGCKMQNHGLVKREQLDSRDAMGLLMGHLAYDHLRRASDLHPGERAAIEALVGMEPPSSE